MSDVSAAELESRRQATLGSIAAGSGYFIWGLSVMYYRQLAAVPAFEILAHRAVWSLLLVTGCIFVFGRRTHLMAVLRDRRTFGVLCITATIIGSNWLVFIWAVNSGRILETSLGYFINPLMSVLTGVVLLGERLSRAQGAAIALAALGVLYFTVSLGHVPWISLFLAASFAGYGYLLFTYGAQRIRLTTLGLLQYLVPTTSFSIAVWVYGEPLGHGQMVTFGLIWTGLAIFTFDTWWRDRKNSGPI